MINILFALLMTVSVLGFLGLIRNQIVYNIRTKAITSIFSYGDWQEKKSLLDNPSYYGMLFDLTKWSFKAFYPEHYQRDLNRQTTSPL